MFRFVAIVLAIFVHSVAAHSQVQPSENEHIAAILDQIKKRATLKFSPTTIQMAIDAAAYELQRISTVTIAASINEPAINVVIAEQLKEDGKFKNPRFKLSGQSIDGAIDHTGTLSIPVVGQVEVNVELHARLASAVQIVTSGPTTEFKVSFAVSALDVKTLRVTRNGVPFPGAVNEVADVVLNTLLVPAQALLNRIEVHIPTTISTTIELPPKQQPGLIVSFSPKSITPKLQIGALTHITDAGRLTVVAQEGGVLKNVASKPTNVAFDVLRAGMEKTLISNGATWIKEGQLAAYVDRELLQRLAAMMLKDGPICINANLKELPLPFDTKLKLPPVESIDCTPTRDCTPTKDCRQTMECSQGGDCRACLLRAPRVCVFGGCTGGQCVQSGNDPVCEARKVANKANCELEKERRRGQCELDKVANKAACEAAKTGEKAACEAAKESYRRIRATGTDYANVESKDLLLAGSAKVCVNELAFDPKTLTLTGKLNVEAVAKADGHVKFTPLNAGHLTCFAPFETSLDGISAAVPGQAITINTSAKVIDDTAKFALEANFANPIHIRYPFAAIAAKLAGDPKFAVLCPIPSTTLKVRVLTPDGWWPQSARGNIERDVPDFRFDLDFVQKPIKLGKLQIAGRLRSNKTGLGGVFTLAKPAKS